MRCVHLNSLADRSVGGCGTLAARVTLASADSGMPDAIAASDRAAAVGHASAVLGRLPRPFEIGY